MPTANFCMQGIAHSTVKVACVSGLEHDAKILALCPVPLLSKLRLHAFIKYSARQRVGERDADIVGTRAMNHGNGFLRVFPGFSRISELQEIACTDSCFPEALTCFDDRWKAQPLVHCIQYFLGAGLHPHPDLRTTGSLKCFYGCFVHQICA